MMRVLNVLEGQKGVHRAEADIAPKTVKVFYDPQTISAQALVEAVNHADIRLQFRHKLSHGLQVMFGGANARTAHVLSDRPM